MDRNKRRKLLDRVMAGVMRVSVLGAAVVLALILGIIVYRGLPGLSWELVTRPPEGSFYLGGGGGILVPGRDGLLDAAHRRLDARAAALVDLGTAGGDARGARRP